MSHGNTDFLWKLIGAVTAQPSCSLPRVLQRYQQATDRKGRHFSPRRSTLRRFPYTFAMARSRPTSPRGRTSGSRRTMMRKTESVQGPIPFMPAKASSQDWPCCTLSRSSPDLCRMVTQHCARRSGRPIARRLATSGSEAIDGVSISGCADLTSRAMRHATWVEICCAITIRAKPQMGSSVGTRGQRSDWEAISAAIVESRAES